MEKQKQRIAVNEKILNNSAFQRDMEDIDQAVKKDQQKAKKQKEYEEKEKQKKAERKSEANKFAKKAIIDGE